jgi:hypothetical protein
MVPLKIHWFYGDFHYLCNNIVSPFILGSDLIVKTRMLLNLSQGNAYFISAPKQVFSLSTVVMAG